MIEKFRRLSSDVISTESQEQLITVVRNLENEPDMLKIIELLAAI